MGKTRTVEIDAPLMTQVERAAAGLHTSTGAFIEAALAGALKRHRQRELEKEDEEGYRRVPQTEAEADEWAPVQAWPD